MTGLIIRADVIREAAAFLEDAGSYGKEGTGMFGAEANGDDLIVTRFMAPAQEAGTYPRTWVEVTEVGKRQLATQLSRGEIWVARIHSHPSEAFHSSIDDENPGLTAVGSWSIVVPYFGLGLRRGIEACAVHERGPSVWRRLPVEEVALRVLVIND